MKIMNTAQYLIEAFFGYALQLGGLQATTQD